MIDWIRGSRKLTKGMPNVWTYLLHSFLVMSEWLVWKPGNDLQIKVGEDPLIGSTSFFKLFDAMLHFLHEKGIYYLSQISRINGTNNVTLSWILCYRFGSSSSFTSGMGRIYYMVEFMWFATYRGRGCPPLVLE